MPDLYTIQPDDDLARRVPISDVTFQNDRPTSAAFKTKPGENGLSVNILSLSSIEATVLDKEKYKVAVFKASLVLNLGYECKHDPQEDNHAHALIVGDTKKIAKKISQNSIIY